MRIMVRASFDAYTEAKASYLALGKDKAQYLAACFLILPV